MAVELKASTGSKKAKTSYPTISVMVNTAIKELKEHNGSSVHAIRKYLSEIYKATSDVVYMHMKKYLRSAVKEGKLVQTRGHGAYGSFRLPSEKKLKALTKATASKKPIESPQRKKPEAKKTSDVVKKVTTEIKNATAKKKPIAKNPIMIKFVVKRKPAKSVATKNIKTPQSRSASKQ